MIRLCALDDHPLILEGYESMFEGDEEIFWKSGFNYGKDLIQFLGKDECDIILMDMHLKDQKDGVHWCGEVKKLNSEIKVIGVSTFEEMGIIKSFLKAGGNGFVLKSEDPTEIKKGILEVYKGNEYISTSLKESILDQSLKNQMPIDYIPKLSDRENEVLKLIIEECTTTEISEQLNLSPSTIETHRRNLISKFGVKNVAGLVREAMRKNVV